MFISRATSILTPFARAQRSCRANISAGITRKPYSSTSPVPQKDPSPHVASRFFYTHWCRLDRILYFIWQADGKGSAGCRYYISNPQICLWSGWQRSLEALIRRNDTSPKITKIATLSKHYNSFASRTSLGSIWARISHFQDKRDVQDFGNPAGLGMLYMKYDEDMILAGGRKSYLTTILAARASHLVNQRLK